MPVRKWAQLLCILWYKQLAWTVLSDDDDGHLTPQLEALVRQQLEGGPCRTADEVIAEALSLLDERDRRRRLLAALDAGAQGEGIPFTAALLDEIDREVDERVRRGDAPSPDGRP